MRFISLGSVLFLFWLLLSGHYSALLVGLGVASVSLTLWIARRMEVVDKEGHPVHLLLGVLSYWPWLALEIVKSTIEVSRIVLSPRLPITPRLIKIRAGQTTPVGIDTFANSITLTPGTITVDVKGNELTVHALTQAGADDLASGRMNRRVDRLEGRP